jgi:hypothetical protein
MGKTRQEGEVEGRHADLCRRHFIDEMHQVAHARAQAA